MTSHSSASRARRVFALAALPILLLGVGACGDDPTEPLADDPARPGADTKRVLGLVEITISGLGTSEPRASAAAPAFAGGPSFALSAPANADASGDGSIQVEPVAIASFTEGERGSGGVRYVSATFRVRNADLSGAAYDTPRGNLTFFAVATASTIDETAVSRLVRFDGSDASIALAQDILPTGAVHLEGGERVVTAADVLQAITEDEVAAIAAPPAVTTVFPYGFVVRNAEDGSGVLPARPAEGDFAGILTVAFRIPLQASPADDPFVVSVMFLALDDTETRVTESLEEQGTGSAQTGADELGPAAGVTLLGNSATAVSGHGVRRICRVRTAGTDPMNPAATLVEAGGCTEGTVSLPGNVIVVDAAAAPGGDGATWTTAFQFLQDALSCIRDGDPGCTAADEIWVAAGSYYPDEGTGQTDNDRASRFDLIEGVGLYGGFAGGEYLREQRDRTANETVLDGDLDQSGTIGLGTDADSLLYAGVAGGAQVTAATVVDGFTVRGAAIHAMRCVADGDGSECSPTVSNVTFEANRGGVELDATGGGTVAPLFTDVSFVGNGNQAALLVSVTGATATPVLVRALFDGNQASTRSPVELQDVSDGGILELRFYSAVFRNNLSQGAGGVMRVGGGATVWVTNSTFWNNSAAGSVGGAIATTGGAQIILSHVTMAGNTAGQGGGIHQAAAAAAQLANTIVWGNTPEDVFSEVAEGDRLARFSLIGGGCPEGFTCDGVLDQDPLFLDLPSGDLQLDVASPALDAGSNTLLPSDAFDLDGDGDTTEPVPFDLAGLLRLVNSVVDIGAYENQ